MRRLLAELLRRTAQRLDPVPTTSVVIRVSGHSSGDRAVVGRVIADELARYERASGRRQV